MVTGLQGEGICALQGNDDIRAKADRVGDENTDFIGVKGARSGGVEMGEGFLHQ